MERLLNELVEKLKKAHQERLVAVLLYGSAATGDHDPEFSDLNILCVLARVTPAELGESEPVFRWWREHDNPAPLLLSTEEVRNSTDCFPIEFHDIKERNKLLFGEDVTAGLAIDRSFYRAQVEHELRAKVIRLRQKAAGVLSDRDLLVRLLVDSISTFCVLMRHALILHGVEAQWRKREVVAQAAARFGIQPDPFVELLDVREKKRKPRDVRAVPLLTEYMKEIGVLVDAVDRLEK